MGNTTFFRSLAPPPPPRSGNAESVHVQATSLVLVVDDEPALLELAREYLECAGYRVLTAQNGPEALELQGQFRDRIIAVVTDLTMPHLDGRELIRAMGARDPKLRVVGTSGGDGGPAPASGCCRKYEFLPKPYTDQQLLAALARALSA